MIACLGVVFLGVSNGPGLKKFEGPWPSPRAKLTGRAPPPPPPAVVCLKDWNLADKRLHDHVREAALVTDTENLNLSKHEWIHDNSPSPENND